MRFSNRPTTDFGASPVVPGGAETRQPQAVDQFLSDMSAWAQAYRKAVVRQWLDARIAHWACVYRTGAGWIDAEHALIVLRAERARLDRSPGGDQAVTLQRDGE